MDNETVAEVWKPVVGYEGLYSVSSMGRVASLVYRNAGAEKRNQFRILKQCLIPEGYFKLDLSDKANGRPPRPFRVHRLVATAFLGIPSHELMEVDHLNGIRSDNRACNLQWVTASENIRLGFERLGGNPMYGEKHYAAQINFMQARIIKACARLGLPRGWQSMLARDFGVSLSVSRA